MPRALDVYLPYFPYIERRWTNSSEPEAISSLSAPVRSRFDLKRKKKFILNMYLLFNRSWKLRKLRVAVTVPP